MPPNRFVAGQIVLHPAKPEWGPGKVVEHVSDVVSVIFRDIPGSAVRRFNTGVVTLQLAPSQEDFQIVRLRTQARSTTNAAVSRISVDAAVQYFLSELPGGFHDPNYGARERDSKWRSHQKLFGAIGDGRGEQLLTTRSDAELGKYFLAAERGVKLLSLYEKTAFADAMKNPPSVLRYAEALLGFVRSDEPMQASFEHLVSVVGDLSVRSGGTSMFKWTTVTIMPFLARPDRFMFLKPEVTKRFAAMLGWNINYKPAPNWLTYRLFHENCQELLGKLQPFGAIDFIDVQSFIWVVGRSKL